MTLHRIHAPVFRLLILPFALLALVSPPARAQLKHEGPAKLIALSKTVSPYDVASIKQNDTAADSATMNIRDSNFIARNMPLENVIGFAFDVPLDRISGLAGSLKDVRFDIDAKIIPSDGGKPPDTSASEDQAKIILLLQDRFHLRVHIEPKIMPVYDLVVAKGGPKIKLSEDELHDSNWNINGQDTSVVLTSKGASMADLSAALSDQVHRQVIDKTGLVGHADITLKWSDDVAAQQGGPNVISIFTAIEDQLGLRLQSAKGPVDTLVLDQVEMPTQN